MNIKSPFSLLFITCLIGASIVNGQSASVLPTENAENAEGWQDIYLRIHKAANEVTPLEIAERVAQKPFTFPPYIPEGIDDAKKQKKFSEMEGLAQDFSAEFGVIKTKDSEGRTQIQLTLPIGLFIDSPEQIIKVCGLGSLGEGSDEILSEGISYGYLFNTQSQTDFTGTIKALCKEEEAWLLQEKNMITKEVLKTNFLKGSGQGNPFDPLKENNTRKNEMTGQQNAGNETVVDTFDSTSYNAQGSGSQGGLVSFDDPYAFSPAQLFHNPSAAGALSILTGKPSSNVNSGGTPPKDPRTPTGQGAEGFDETKNKANFSKDDVSIAGNLNAIKTYLTKINSYPLLGQCAAHYFGEVPFLDWKGDGGSFLQHDPYDMHVYYEVPYSEEESVEETLDNKDYQFTDEYKSAESFIFDREICEDQVTGVSREDSLINLSECEQRQRQEFQNHLNRLAGDDLVRKQNDDWNRSSQRNEQEKAEMESLLKGLKQLTMTLETLSQKPRKQ